VEKVPTPFARALATNCPRHAGYEPKHGLSLFTYLEYQALRGTSRPKCRIIRHLQEILRRLVPTDSRNRSTEDAHLLYSGCIADFSFLG